MALEPFAGKSGEPPLIESLHRCHAPFCGDFLPSRLAVAALVAVPGVLARNDAPAADTPRVLAAHLDNDINPVTQEFVENSVDRAEDGGYAAYVLVLDTPGGLGSSMRGIVKRFLAAKVPVDRLRRPAGLVRGLRRSRHRDGLGRGGHGSPDQHRLVDADLAQRRGHLEGSAPEDRQRRCRIRRRARTRARPQRRGGAQDGHRGVELRRTRGEADRARRGDRSQRSLRCSTRSTGRRRFRRGSC